VGLPSADVLAVGPAPTRQEDQTGLAFTGPAGQFLSAILESLGFDSRRVYYTTVIKCYPGKAKMGDLKPPAYALDACRSWLKSEYDLVQPKVILAMGDVAMKAFGVKGGIKKNHAKVFYTEEWGPVVPVISPIGLFKPSDVAAFVTGLNILNTYLRGFATPPEHEER
jgi:uracil-DNA glycosylase family 4